MLVVFPLILFPPPCCCCVVVVLLLLCFSVCGSTGLGNNPNAQTEDVATKRLFTFGTVALTQFLHTRLIDFPNMCDLLTQSTR